MTTLAARRTELSAALTAAGVRYAESWKGEPPYVVAFFDGSDLSPMVNGSCPVNFAVVLVVAKALDDVALAAVDAGVEDVYGVLLALDGWKIRSIDSLVFSTTPEGSQQYTVTFRVDTMTELGG